MQEPFWITKEAALAMHERQLAEHGGGEGVRDEGLLESALAKPQNLFFYSDGPVDTSRLAASYAYGVATNHPFVDGNAGSTLVISHTFLKLNGFDLSAIKEDIYLTVAKLVAGEMDETGLAEWFRGNVKKINN